MRAELEHLQFIEHQLLRTSAAVPATDWQLRLLLDGELHADAAAQQQLYRALHRAGRQQLRQELAGIHDRLYAPRSGYWQHKLHRLLTWLRSL